MNYLKNILQRSFNYQSSIKPNLSPVFQPNSVNVNMESGRLGFEKITSPDGWQTEQSDIKPTGNISYSGSGENGGAAQDKAPAFSREQETSSVSEQSGNSLINNVLDKSNKEMSLPQAHHVNEQLAQSESRLDTRNGSPAHGTSTDFINEIITRRSINRIESDVVNSRSDYGLNKFSYQDMRSADIESMTPHGEKSQWAAKSRESHHAAISKNEQLTHYTANYYEAGLPTSVKKTININIGQIEVKAAKTKPQPVKTVSNNKIPEMSLNEYLAKRNSGER